MYLFFVMHSLRITTRLAETYRRYTVSVTYFRTIMNIHCFWYHIWLLNARLWFFWNWHSNNFILLRPMSEGRRPLGRPRRRWVDNIRMDFQEVECGYMDWIGLAEDRDRWRTLVSAVTNIRVPWNAENFLTSCKPVSFSRRTLHHGVSK